ncbi:MAG: endonuclease/exonuclease/phosphatase family protein [Acidimicrobiales bacterium]
MRIVSFNVQHGRGADAGVHTSALARYCAGLAADVLGLQEVDVGARRSGSVDQAALVAQATGMTHVFGRASRVGARGAYGNALLVRGRVTDVDVISLPRIARHEPRAAVLARAELADGELSVAVTHLSVDPVESRRQLDAVLGALAARPLPRVLLGDLNLTADDVSGVIAGAGLSLTDTTERTFPAVAPRARIDHIAVVGLEILSVEVSAPAPVSDHLALVVQLGVA